MDEEKQTVKHAFKYVAIDDASCENKDVLRQVAEEVPFPLSQEDDALVAEMLKRLVKEPNCAGLAAPQLGYSRQIIVFHVPEEVSELRTDMTDVVPATVLINPIYEPQKDKGMRKDWEGCFSVHKTAGEVWRYNTISYAGYTVEGKRVEGAASGFLARLLQHEIDHLNGILCLDHFAEGCRHGSIEDMRALRLQASKPLSGDLLAPSNHLEH